MPLGNGIAKSPHFLKLHEDKDSTKKALVIDDVDEDAEDVEVLEGVDFTKYVDVVYITPEQAEKRAAAAKAKERPVDYRYVDQMKREGVTEELAVKAFVGRFGGNEPRTRFFLNSDFYYGSEAPTPLTRLIKAFEEDTISECIEMIEGTRISWYQGAHF